MTAERPPEEVRRLAHERSAARAARDFDRADELRDQLRRLGWEASDSQAGTKLRPALPPAPDSRVAYARPEDLASLIDEPTQFRPGLVHTVHEFPRQIRIGLRLIVLDRDDAVLLRANRAHEIELHLECVGLLLE